MVNQAGKLRLTYTDPSSSSKGSFISCDITTDSNCFVLTADFYNNCIHIMDKDRQFPCYIDNWYLHGPWGFDPKDILVLAEYIIGKRKKIQYYV